MKLTKEQKEVLKQTLGVDGQASQFTDIGIMLAGFIEAIFEVEFFEQENEMEKKQEFVKKLSRVLILTERLKIAFGIEESQLQKEITRQIKKIQENLPEKENKT